MTKEIRPYTWPVRTAVQCCVVGLFCYIVGFTPLYSVYEPGGLDAALEMHCYFTHATLDTCDSLSGFNACYAGLHHKGSEDCRNFFLQLGSVATYSLISMICYSCILGITVCTTAALLLSARQWWWFPVDTNLLQSIITFLHLVNALFGAVALHATVHIITQSEYNTANAVGTQTPIIGAAAVSFIMLPIVLLLTDLLYTH